jgi:DNA-binding NtrC family response regulator
MIHGLGSRAKKAFVAVNCPSIPVNDLESELFGYGRGAAAGAVRGGAGLFEAADGGTILLDEIGDMPLVLQAKLLKVLEGKEFKPPGESRGRRMDARIIASTNQDLEEMISRDEFRDDLYYRLNVVSIHTPSLREIPEDIPLIAEWFLSVYCAELGVLPKKFSGEALAALAAKRWSGNVRELQNELKRAIIFSTGERIVPADLDGEYRGRVGEPEGALASLEAEEYRKAKRRILDRFDTEYITRALGRAGGNVTEAARKAGLGRQSLQYLMKKHGIEGSRFRSGAR